jgi:hypothetical protein
MMGMKRSSETSFLTRATRRLIPEYGTLHTISDYIEDLYGQHAGVTQNVENSDLNDAGEDETGRRKYHCLKISGSEPYRY